MTDSGRAIAAIAASLRRMLRGLAVAFRRLARAVARLEDYFFPYEDEEFDMGPYPNGEAAHRAHAELLTYLTPTQRRSADKHGYFVVPSRDATIRYHLYTNGSLFMVDRQGYQRARGIYAMTALRDDFGRRIGHISYPEGDTALAILLLLQTDEATLDRMAC